MARYRLHYFPESGKSYKLALMLTCGQDFEPVWTDFGGGITFTPEWRRTVNPMGEIPVLEVDGVSLTQTAPILLRLADTYGRLHRYRRAFMPPAQPEVLAYLKARVDDFLTIVEQRVQDRAFIVGDRPTVVDLSMSGYLSFPKQEAGYDLAASHPNIHAWLQRIAALPGWKAPYDLLGGKRLRSYVGDA